MKNDEIIVVESNDYDQTQEDKPLIYTYELYPFLSIIYHLHDSAILFSIEETKNMSHSYENLNTVTKEVNDDIEYADIFIGKECDETNLQELERFMRINEIPYNIYPLFSQDGIESIGYNYNENKYYGVVFHTISMGFDEYKIQNKLIRSK